MAEVFLTASFAHGRCAYAAYLVVLAPLVVTTPASSTNTHCACLASPLSAESHGAYAAQLTASPLPTLIVLASPTHPCCSCPAPSLLAESRGPASCYMPLDPESKRSCFLKLDAIKNAIADIVSQFANRRVNRRKINIATVGAMVTLTIAKLARDGQLCDDCCTNNCLTDETYRKRGITLVSRCSLCRADVEDSEHFSSNVQSYQKSDSGFRVQIVLISAVFHIISVIRLDRGSIRAQGNVIRTLKASGVAKPQIDATIEALNALKLKKASIEKSLLDSSDTREAFRQAMVNTLEWRLFYIPSFKIFCNVARLFDYGPMLSLSLVEENEVENKIWTNEKREPTKKYKEKQS
ncbi:hypothetical protein Fmac_008818 [Flemingia macrophylla]|uniref:WHEP-TRS domain-containing protein n=1 Tax=Flemingia macrophylla TaxID=520843 RepID=A0ABD1MZN9_9FABA